MGFYDELTPRLALVSFLGSLGALSFGYDNGWWGMILVRNARELVARDNC